MKNIDNYMEIGSINLNEMKIIYGFVFLFFIIVGVSTIYIFEITEKNIISRLFIILSCIGYIVIHESIHILVMRIVSKEKIYFNIKFPTIAVGSRALFSKNQYIIAAIAPFAILGIVLTLLFFVLTEQFFLLLSILLTLNFAGASGDFLVIFITLKSPKEAYFQDNSKITKIYMLKTKIANKHT